MTNENRKFTKVDNPKIDDAHAEIIRTMDGAATVTSKAGLLSVIIDIYKHASVHFLEEEQFMKDQGMPRDYVYEHSGHHIRLRKHIQSVIMDIDSYSLQELKQLLSQMKDLMLHHIEAVDSRMVEYLDD